MSELPGSPVERLAQLLREAASSGLLTVLAFDTTQGASRMAAWLDARGVRVGEGSSEPTFEKFRDNLRSAYQSARESGDNENVALRWALDQVWPLWWAASSPAPEPPLLTDAQWDELYLVMRSARRAGKSAPRKAEEFVRRLGEVSPRPPEGQP